MHSDTSLRRTFRDFSRALRRIIPASTLAQSDDTRLAPEAVTVQLIRHQSRVDAILRRRPRLGARVPHFFEYGAGI
jgi:hypothetical protein